jgi:hypothetical protein
MNDRELLEAALSPHRQSGADGQLRFHPAFFDLDTAGRQRLFIESLLQRRLEAAADPDGLSSTARAVLSRLRKP